MDGFLIRFAFSLLFSFSIAARALKRKSVDFSAVFVGIPAMVIHMLAGYRFAALLLVFFSTSSKVTRFGQEKKRGIEADFKEGGQRNWIQVLANSLIATVLVVILTIKTQGQDKCLDTEDSAVVTALLGGIVGHYACCNGDTWSSELGMLSSDQPRLITTLKKVRKGTNGAVTIHGLVAAIAAGFAIGITFALIGLLTTECSLNVLWRQLLIVPIAAAAGLIGSLIDSLLGATLQFSGYCTVRKKVVGKHGPTVIKISGTSMLDNNAVNAVSILLTTLVTSITCLYIF
ncbi:protein PGR-like [Zingiber officinale]|uniref:protein PGR-like n=1 Tax=Zingiber officinale TaxID=94328 RepID=UPI001C4DD509|nr:protein PGR-like [Zingiber officinale]XP_042454622.1 protein PGR-like [Zingiber officinale]XP_042454623.1 protein PGR-like [Zingiber officinale]